MARKATPEELAMHQSAETPESPAAQLEDALANGNGVASDNTAPGDLQQDTNTEPPKKKRGRPTNAEKALQESLEKENPGAAVAGAVEANKPGRKPNKGAKPNGEALGKQLVGLHSLGAMIFQIPMMQITDDEGASLGAAIVAVCEEYGLSVTGKTGAALQLLGAMSMIYVPRIFMFKAAQAAAIAQARANADQQGVNASVHQLHPGQG